MIPIWKETLFFSGVTRLAVNLSAAMELGCVTLTEDVGCKLTVTNKS